MGKVFDGIDEGLAQWISAQPLWFVATAPLAAEGHVNVSPRGHDSLRILGPDRVAWVDYTGSGVETIAHVRENGRLCLMFASFDHRPRTLVVRSRTGKHLLPGGTVGYSVAVAGAVSRRAMWPGVAQGSAGRGVTWIMTGRSTGSCWPTAV